MVELMTLAEQVEMDFVLARRRARFRWLAGRLRRRTCALVPFEQRRRSVGAYGGLRRGRSTVEVAKIVGSAGKHDQFDDRFMPLGGASADRWKRIDRAHRGGAELPPVALYAIDDEYFVQDGHHRVSVARYHGAEWIDAEVTQFRSSRLPGDGHPSRPYAPVRFWAAAASGHGRAYGD